MGTIRRRGDSFQGIVRVTGHEAQYRTFDTRKEAREWVRDTEMELESRVVTSPDILISDLTDKYITEIAPKRKMARSHLEHDIPSISRAFKGMRMRDLIGRGLTDWTLRDNQETQIRSWHVARLFALLRQVETHFDIKVPWADMKRCRDQLRELGYLSPSNERDRRVSDDELDAIKSHIGKDVRVRVADVFDFCVTSAMRISEVCRVLWSDVNERDRTILIRDRKHPRKKFGNHQIVPLLNGSFDVLIRQPRSQTEIFPYDKANLSRHFQVCATKAGLENIVLHDLRHEAISRLFELGFAIQEVAIVSGHRDWRMLKRYTHLSPAALVEKERRLRSKAV